jgi:cytochrome c-type biogenesis protein CcmF
MAPALFLMGVGPLARWRDASAGDLTRRLRWAVGVSVASALVAPWVLGYWTPMVGLGLLLAMWVASTAVLNLLTRLREHPAPNWWARLAAQPGSYYGMLLAHGGVAVFIAGVTVVSGFSSENDVRMEPGDSAQVGGYSFLLQTVKPVEGPNYSAARATLTVSLDGKPVATLYPERRVYKVSRMPMTEVAIDRGLGRDLYVALGEPVSATAWSVRLHHKPLVNWIWIGCLLMGLGGVLAVTDRRYRSSRRLAGQAVPA